jgi:hypothetical protein
VALIENLSAYGTDLDQQDAVFYTGGDVEVVWKSDDCDFYVVACGDTRILLVDEEGKEHDIRQPADLEGAGIKSDTDFKRLADKDLITWYNNPWFEVYSDTDLDYYSEPMYELDEAIGFAYAQHNERHPQDLNKQEPDIIY